MFTPPSTATSPTRAMYKAMRTPTLPPSSTTSSHASFPIVLQDVFTHPHSYSSSLSSHSSTSSLPSLTTDDYILSPPLTSSPIHSHFDLLTPSRYFDVPPSPSPMPAYSPYGISGSLIVPHDAGLHSTSQQPISGVDQLYAPPSTLPSKHITTTPTPSTRPALRTTYSHNGVLSSSLALPSLAPAGTGTGTGTAHWPRRTMTSDAITSSPATAHHTTPSHLQRTRGTYEVEVASSSVPVDPSVPGRHEASAPASYSATAPHSVPLAPATSVSAEYAPMSHPHPSYHDDSAPAYPPAYHTQPYPSAGAYEAAYPQSWPPVDYHRPPHFGLYHHYAMANVKPEEPILMPGELPAPRPPKSYAALIGEALLMAPPPHQLYVSEISDSVKKRYAYYRQNPSKIYNGVRHQTSMCKAFVKLPRPFGDQSGGARKWAIRKGCESWFHGGGYYPPGSPPLSSATLKRPPGGKAKATAQAKRLAIGTASSPEMDSKGNYEPYSPRSQGGPSVGPAFDGTDQPRWFQSSPDTHQFSPYVPAPPSSHMRHPGQPAPSHPPPGAGYQYVPITPAPGHPSGATQMWAPVYSQHHPGMYYQPHPGQGYAVPYTPPITQPAGSPQWPGYDNRTRAHGSDHESAGSYDEAKHSPQSQPERGLTPPGKE